jgi:hypothetical protein
MQRSARPVCLSLLLVASAFSLDARAEGAVKLLECDIVRVCDAGGICDAGSGDVQFRMEPVELAGGGAGSYRISYGEVQFSMQAMSDIGPFVLMADSERNTLIASSDTQWLWHELELGAAPRAAVRFLTCTFQQ